MTIHDHVIEAIRQAGPKGADSQAVARYVGRQMVMDEPMTHTIHSLMEQGVLARHPTNPRRYVVADGSVLCLGCGGRMEPTPDRAVHRCDACGSEVTDLDLLITRHRPLRDEATAAYADAKVDIESLQLSESTGIDARLDAESSRRLLRLLVAYRNGMAGRKMNDMSAINYGQPLPDIKIPILPDTDNFEERVQA